MYKARIGLALFGLILLLGVIHICETAKGHYMDLPIGEVSVTIKLRKPNSNMRQRMLRTDI